MPLSVLHKKLLREALHLKGQLIAVALVVACGVMVFVSMSSVKESLVRSKDQYYSNYRFADVFLQVKRAPAYYRERVKAIPGVASLSTRLVYDVSLDIEGLDEPATGQFVSLPPNDGPILNDLFIRDGRRLSPTAHDEIIVSEAFAEANALEVGDEIHAILNGRKEAFRIVGIGLSPEYIYEVQSGAFFADNKRFGVFWVSQKALEAAFNMSGSFNNLVLTLTHDAVEAEVIRRLDDLFKPYGSLGAYGRSEHVSHQFISDEIKQFASMITVVPSIFLGVAIFLLNIILRRLVSTQRDIIAILKAFGYSNWQVGLHYLGFSLFPIALGGVLGTLLGAWGGAGLTDYYTIYFHFPSLDYVFRFNDAIMSVSLSALAAGFGSLSAVKQAIKLPPAEAMRPESPATFKAFWLEKLGLKHWVTVPWRIIVRNLERRWWKSTLSAIMIGFAVSIMISGRYMYDAMDHMMWVEFDLKHHEDLTLVFTEPLPKSVLYELQNLNGIRQVELVRTEPVRLRYKQRSRRMGITGLNPNSDLRPLIDSKLRLVPVPNSGLLLTTKLAEIIGAKPGDTLTVSFLHGQQRTHQVILSATIDEMFGLAAYMQKSLLDDLSGSKGAANSAILTIDYAQKDSLYAAFKDMPSVTGSIFLKAMKERFSDDITQSMIVTTTILTFFACTIAFAVVYNGARISLSERGRELASLRVLGLRKQEISVILLGEQAILTAFGIPIGFLLGTGLSAMMPAAYDSEIFRMPFILSSENFFFAFIVIVMVAIASGWIINQRLAHLDLIEVLKTRE